MAKIWQFLGQILGKKYFSQSMGFWVVLKYIDLKPIPMGKLVYSFGELEAYFPKNTFYQTR